MTTSAAALARWMASTKTAVWKGTVPGALAPAQVGSLTAETPRKAKRTPCTVTMAGVVAWARLTPAPVGWMPWARRLARVSNMELLTQPRTRPQSLMWLVATVITSKPAKARPCAALAGASRFLLPGMQGVGAL